MATAKEGSLHLFILDTSNWSSKRDQHDEKSRLETQTTAMRLISCALLPEKVGVISMGGYTSRVAIDLPSTSEWRHPNGPGGSGDLAEYVPTRDASASSVRLPDPNRITRALELCLEMASAHRKASTASWAWARVVLFLCSPPAGMAVVRPKLDRIATRLKTLSVDLELVMHPNAYSEKYLSFDAWPTYDPATDASDARCGDGDMLLLQNVFGERCFRHGICMEDFVSTCCSYFEPYLGLDGPLAVYENWRKCYGPSHPFAIDSNVFWQGHDEETRHGETVLHCADGKPVGLESCLVRGLPVNSCSFTGMQRYMAAVQEQRGETGVSLKHVQNVVQACHTPLMNLHCGWLRKEVRRKKLYLAPCRKRRRGSLVLLCTIHDDLVLAWMDRENEEAPTISVLCLVPKKAHALTTASTKWLNDKAFEVVVKQEGNVVFRFLGWRRSNPHYSREQLRKLEATLNKGCTFTNFADVPPRVTQLLQEAVVEHVKLPEKGKTAKKSSEGSRLEKKEKERERKAKGREIRCSVQRRVVAQPSTVDTNSKRTGGLRKGFLLLPPRLSPVTSTATSQPPAPPPSPSPPPPSSSILKGSAECEQDPIAAEIRKPFKNQDNHMAPSKSGAGKKVTLVTLSEHLEINLAPKQRTNCPQDKPAPHQLKENKDPALHPPSKITILNIAKVLQDKSKWP